MKILLIIVLGFVLGIDFLAAQEKQQVICGTDYRSALMAEKYPQLAAEREKKEQLIYEMSQAREEGQMDEAGGSGASRIVPVVFHIIHQYGPENLSKQTILDAVEQLNLDWQKDNPDLSQARTVFQAVAADMDVEFRLARKDPTGNCTEGIVRVESPHTNRGEDVAIKNLSRWDTRKYLNIWVVRDIASIDGFTTAGYAFFPGAVSNALDGIVIDADFMGAGERTLTHEVGHYMNLYHPFQGGCGGSNCNLSGDRVCDTPPTAQQNFGCDKSTNSCSNDSPDQPDMLENFMDYSSCDVMFTTGQKVRVDDAFTVYRSQLISQSNLVATGTDQLYPSLNCKPIADFHSEVQVVCQGESIQFEDLSYNGSVTNYLWNFSGGSPSTSSSANPEITYNTPGLYNVSLTATNSAGSGTTEKKLFVNVLADVSSTKAPYSESFENQNFAATGWSFETDHSTIEWTRSDNASFSGNYSLYLNNRSISSSDGIYSATMPPVDLGAMLTAELEFKVAYAQRSSSSTDQLRIYVSQNCGKTFSPRFVRSASTLETAGGQFINSNFVPSQSQWQTLSLSLGNYLDVRNLVIRFDFISGGGNNIYIDDIQISGAVGIEDQMAGNRMISFYPNPFSSAVNMELNTTDAREVSFTVLDAVGRELTTIDLQQLTGKQEISFSPSELNIKYPGMYFVRGRIDDAPFAYKLTYLNP
ncbi:MAG: M43 family zinc metalloprotease [Bacteroidia bacterium]